MNCASISSTFREEAFIDVDLFGDLIVLSLEVEDRGGEGDWGTDEADTEFVDCSDKLLGGGVGGVGVGKWTIGLSSWTVLKGAGVLGFGTGRYAERRDWSEEYMESTQEAVLSSLNIESTWEATSVSLSRSLADVETEAWLKAEEEPELALAWFFFFPPKSVDILFKILCCVCWEDGPGEEGGDTDAGEEGRLDCKPAATDEEVLLYAIV